MRRTFNLLLLSFLCTLAAFAAPGELMAQNIILIFFLLSIYHHLKLSLEKGVTIHSSMLAWRIPWTEEPGRLQSMRSLRVGHD